MAMWTIVKKSDTENWARCDPEYFDPKYDVIGQKVKKHNMKRIGDEEISSLVTDGDHGNPKYSKNSNGHFYIKSKELTSFGIDFERAEKVPDKYAKKLGNRCALNKEDVLLSTVGTIGIPCIAIDDFPPSVLSRDIAKIVTNKENILPEFLYLYLTTDFAQMQIERAVSGSVQGGLYLYALKKIAVNIPSDAFQKEIKALVKQMIDLNRKSKELHSIGKKAIDISIDKNEKEAIVFLKKVKK